MHMVRIQGNKICCCLTNYFYHICTWNGRKQTAPKDAVYGNSHWENILSQNQRALNVSDSTVSVWRWKNKFGAKGFHSMTNFHNKRRRRICIKRIRILVKLWNEQQNKCRRRIKGWNNGMKAVKSFIPKNTFTRRIHHIRYGLDKNSQEIVRLVIKGTERSQKLFWKRFKIGKTHSIQIWMKHKIKVWSGVPRPICEGFRERNVKERSHLAMCTWEQTKKPPFSPRNVISENLPNFWVASENNYRL